MMDLKKKILMGYFYRTKPIEYEPMIEGERNVTMTTGAGGAKMLIDEYRKVGFNDEAIASMIQVWMEGYGWVDISKVNQVKPDEQQTESNV